MSVGIALVIVFANMPTTDGNAFSPASYYDWSPADGGLPRVVLTEDVDGCCDEIDSVTFGYELKLPMEADH